MDWSLMYNINTYTFKVHIQYQQKMGNVKVGVWGGKDGTNKWSFKLADGSTITKIKICSTSNCVFSIRFTYVDVDNVSHDSTQYGGDGGTAETLTFADEETIIGISGTYAKYNEHVVITSLSFKGSKNNYGPYGTASGTVFSLPVSEGNVVGFFGKYGDHLDSIGVILNSDD